MIKMQNICSNLVKAWRFSSTLTQTRLLCEKATSTPTQPKLTTTSPEAAAEIPRGSPAKLIPAFMKLEEGKIYSWCTCGSSSKKTMCDGKHKEVNAKLKEGEKKFMPIRFKVEKSKTYLLCNCKQSSNRPFCDLTHVSVMMKKFTSRFSK